MVPGKCVSQVGSLGQPGRLWRRKFSFMCICSFVCVVEAALKCVPHALPHIIVWFNDSLLPAVMFEKFSLGLTK